MDEIQYKKELKEEVIEALDGDRQIGDSIVIVIRRDDGERLLFTARKRGNTSVYLLDDKEYEPWELNKYMVESKDYAQEYEGISKIKDIEGTDKFRDAGSTTDKEGLAEAIVNEIHQLMMSNLDQYKKEEEHCFIITTKGYTQEEAEEKLHQILYEEDYGEGRSVGITRVRKEDKQQIDRVIK